MIHVAWEIQRIQKEKQAAKGLRNSGRASVNLVSKPVLQIAVPLMTTIFVIGYTSFVIKVCFMSP